MRDLRSMIGRFRSDERGAFAMIFGVIAIVLVAFSGAVVDFTSMQQARTRAQVALDAAALALQPKIYTSTSAGIRASAQSLVIDRLQDSRTTWNDCATNIAPPCVDVDTAELNTTDGTLTLGAQLSVPMFFVDLVGVPKLDFRIESQATRKKLSVEVAMVLDNTGSMATSMDTGATRMATLKDAAKCATNIIFYNVADCSTSTAGLTANDNVEMAVVPFTSEVNVGTSNASASWLDRSGSISNSIAQDNFDNDDNTSTAFNGPVDRIALFSKMNSGGTPLSWGGCVEARLSPYDTTDDLPVAGTNTMFTPFFAPDEPSGWGYSNSYIDDQPASCPVVPQCVKVQVKTGCSNSDYGSCGKTPSTTYTRTDANRTVTHPSSCSTTNAHTSTDDDSDRVSCGRYCSTYTNTRTTTYTYPPYSFSDRVLQERLCKYDGASASLWGGRGPNGDCPATPILPLTDSSSSVISTINAMSANGATNIHAGTAWGWRVLSPTEPFTQGKPYDQATSKVMIVMTDGENTAYSTGNMNGTSIYQAWGYPYNNRPSSSPAHVRLGAVGDSTSTLEGYMNDRLKTTCDNAKAAGVVIYTIGLATSDTSNPTANQQLLTDCATEPSYAYFPETAADLTSAFTDIAGQLAALRLSR